MSKTPRTDAIAAKLEDLKVSGDAAALALLVGCRKIESELVDGLSDGKREWETMESMDNAAMDKMQAMIREQSERLVALGEYAEALRAAGLTPMLMMNAAACCDGRIEVDVNKRQAIIDKLLAVAKALQSGHEIVSTDPQAPCPKCGNYTNGVTGRCECHAVVPKYEEWSESVEAVSGLAHMMHAGVPSGLADRIMRCAFEAGRRSLSQVHGFATAGNYVADREVYPQRILFANGRTVELKEGALDVGWAHDEAAKVWGPK